jgi:hypothetical protein
MWYQSSFLDSGGHLCCSRFGLVFIDQVYLGSVINLGSMGYFVVVIQVYKEEWRDLIESKPVKMR